MSNLIEFSSVSKRYRKVVALNNLSFSIKDRQFVALVGNNGCGKTTTVNTICNLIPYDYGQVKIFNKLVSPSFVSYKNRLGVLLSPPILVNEFTPHNFLKFVCKFQKVEANSIHKRIDDIVNSFGIPAYKERPIFEYSSGDKMKIALAASLIHNPEILVLDEPFIHLDPKTIAFIVNLLKSIKGVKTLFITSHNLDLVTEICERVLVMDNGAIIEDFSKSDGSAAESITCQIKERLVNGRSEKPEFDWLR